MRKEIRGEFDPHPSHKDMTDIKIGDLIAYGVLGSHNIDVYMVYGERSHYTVKEYLLYLLIDDGQPCKSSFRPDEPFWDSPKSVIEARGNFLKILERNDNASVSKL